MRSANERSSELAKLLQEKNEEAERALVEIRKVAAEHGVSQQTAYFKLEADSHDLEAKKWQKYTIYTASGLAVYAFFSFTFHKIGFIKPENTFDTIQLGLSKALTFGVIAFMLILCARNFMSHKHNSVVNRHRQNALLIFNALAEAATGEDSKNIVLTHAAACIFSPQETGYAKQGGGQDSGGIKLIEIAPKLSGTPAN